MPTLRQIASNTAIVVFPYGEDKITVVYYPSKITEDTYASLESFGELTATNVLDKFGDLNALLASLIKSWDVYEDDAQTQMFPIEASRFSELPVAFRVALLNNVMDLANPEVMTPQKMK